MNYSSAAWLDSFLPRDLLKGPPLGREERGQAIHREDVADSGRCWKLAHHDRFAMALLGPLYRNRSPSATRYR